MDAFTLIADEQYNGVYRALVLRQVPKAHMASLLDELRLAAQEMDANWEGFLESDGAAELRREFGMIWACIGSIETMMKL